MDTKRLKVGDKVLINTVEKEQVVGIILSFEDFTSTWGFMRSEKDIRAHLSGVPIAVRVENLNLLERPKFIYKTKGLDYYVLNAESGTEAVSTLINHRIGVTWNDIEQIIDHPNFTINDNAILFWVESKKSNPENPKREMCLTWWKRVDDSIKLLYCNKFFPGRNYRSLTGREVQHIYESRNSIKTVIDIVDFNKIHSFIQKGCVSIDPDEIRELNKFFIKLGQSSSFAHFTHKELKK